jgi:hypothetical protein
MLICVRQENTKNLTLIVNFHILTLLITYISEIVAVLNFNQMESLWCLKVITNPPMSDLDLLSALTSHFEPHVQQGLICSNLHSTQDALAFLAKLEALENPKRAFRSQRREYDRRDMNRRNQYDQDSGRNRDRGNGVNVRYVSYQAGRNRQWESNRAQGREQSRSSHRRSQGSVAADNSGRLNPEASQFNPFLLHDETGRETTGNSRSEGVTTVSLNN